MGTTIMAEKQSYKVGSAPWEASSQPKSFKVGAAPWEMQSSTPQQPQEESLGRRFTRSAIDTVLPVAGAVAAGLVATPESAGLATIPAGAAGYAGGKQAARLLRHYILGDDIGAKEVGDLAKQTVGDFGEGVLMETGGQIIAKPIEMAAPYLKSGYQATKEGIKSFAEKQMAKQVGAGAKEFENQAAAKLIGRNALDNKIAGPFTSAEESLIRATKTKEAAGKSMNEVYKAVDETIGPSVNPLDTAVKVEKELAPTYRTPINKSEVGQLENTIESILARGNENIHLGEAQALKKEIDSVAYPKGKAPVDPTPKQQMAADASRIIRQEIDIASTKGAEAIGSQDLLKKLADARKTYGASRQAEKLLTKQVGREEMGVGKKINWTADPVKLVSSIVKKVSPNMAATKAIVADSIASVLEKAPMAFGKFSPILKEASKRGSQDLASVHLFLSKSNPEYTAIFKKAAEAKYPTKGPEKWANDGIKKIQEHDSSVSPEILDKLMKTQKGRDLLIKASDLSPGSKAMDQIIGKIKSSSVNGGE